MSGVCTPVGEKVVCEALPVTAAFISPRTSESFDVTVLYSCVS